MTPTPIWDLSNVEVSYSVEQHSVTALDGVSLRVQGGGRVLGVVGESGSGKTTLGLGVMNLIEPPGRISGTIQYNGKDVLSMSKEELQKYRWEEVSMVYQSAMNSLNPVKSISDPIMEVLMQHRMITKEEARDSALSLLSSVGIKADRANDYPHEISGGMRQRVVIALALALSPKLLIADEPTSALDVVIQRQILSLLSREKTQRNLSMLFITHEIALLSDFADEAIVMYAGEIAEQGPLEKMLSEPLHPYTEMLLDTALTLDSGLSGLQAKKTLSESNDELPPGACRYANRCKYAFDRCKNERPRLKEKSKGRWVACHKYD